MRLSSVRTDMDCALTRSTLPSVSFFYPETTIVLQEHDPIPVGEAAYAALAFQVKVVA